MSLLAGDDCFDTLMEGVFISFSANCSFDSIAVQFQYTTKSPCNQGINVAMHVT